MALSYTTAAARDAARTRQRSGLDPWELALVAISLAAAVLVLVAFTRASSERQTSASDGPPVNLNLVAEPSALEPVVGRVLSEAPDRRLAAQAVYAFLVQADGGSRTISDVRSIGRARVDAAAIARTSGATAYRARLAGERARAAAGDHPQPQSIAALTQQEVAALEPLLAVRTHASARRALLFWLAIYVLAFHGISLMWRLRHLEGDRVLLAAAHLLTAIGFAIMVSRADPTRDSMLFVRYAQGIFAGACGAVLCSLLNLRTSTLRHLSYVPLLGAFALSAALLAFGSGPAGSHARVNLGLFQPIEAIRILLALFFAGYFARHWELLRAVRTEAIRTMAVPHWLHLPRPRYALPLLTGVAVALVLFYVQRDLGPALILSVVFLATYGVARGRVGLMLCGALLIGAGFYLGYHLGISATLADRVRMWASPWDNGVRGGSQIAHALWAMSTGATFGTGAGLGSTGYIPAGATDLVLASIGEEYGFAGLLVVALVYGALAARSLSTARRASTDYGFFLAVTLALFLIVPVLLMAAGTMGVVPLTGLVTPFLSYGGSAMLANFCALGLLASIRSDSAPAAPLSTFEPALRWLVRGLAVAGAALVLVAARIQVIQADTLVVRPHLGIQADGVRRFQDNPRMLDVVRAIPRGTIVDRNGLPLATDDRALLQSAAKAYAAAGVDVSGACPAADERCYPLGGRAFHVLGDVRSRVNWGASNTSFVERDEEPRLRGFDDHATVVAVTEADGSQGTAIRHDYRDLVPLLRHRRDPRNPVVRDAMDTHRQLRLTIDARLQARTASIVAKYAQKSASGHAAAVVLDAATGDLLASVSYPWPADTTRFEPSEDADALLDRARYGLYPPGSTFKLVTAAAALARDSGAPARTFTCSRLPDGRAGATLPGYARPVRDDELDRTPHGTIDMHRALVVSCNAYFAQLAVRIGPQALLDASRCVEIPLARNNAPARIRDTLPQIGYGQGEVVASPLRMARIAAAIASDGNIRDAPIAAGTPVPDARRFVSPAIARLLGGYMRDAVLDGTGRSLRAAAVPIAGKTGTAELARQPSHSWFVGFAPYGAASRRVAVAVILENAGYGGAAAAPAAGDILTAAAALGLAR